MTTKKEYEIVYFNHVEKESIDSLTAALVVNTTNAVYWVCSALHALKAATYQLKWLCLSSLLALLHPVYSSFFVSDPSLWLLSSTK